MKYRIRLLLASLLLVASTAWADSYQHTGFTTVNIFSDNGVTYFSPNTGTISGNCLNNRVELRETGDFYGNVENGRRMYAMILTAQAEGKLINLEYYDADGPACRLAGVTVQW